MQRRIYAMFLCLMLWSGSASANAKPTELYSQALFKQYQRIELVVPQEFNAICRNELRGDVHEGICQISEYRNEFLAIFKADFQQGTKVDLSQAKQGLIRFTFSQPNIKIQSKILTGPPRWVIEMGEPDVLFDLIEDELSFKPYPIPANTVKLSLPVMMIGQLPGDFAEIQGFNAALALFEEKKYQESLNLLAKINIVQEQNRPVALYTRKLIAENWVEISKVDNKFDLDKAKAALNSAEAAATNEREKARYVILQSDLMINKGKIEEAEQYLERQKEAYKTKEAEPFILSELARILLIHKETAEAEKILRRLQEVSSQFDEDVGARLIALGSISYEKKDFATAFTFFDDARKNFDQLLRASETSLFQLAELYFRVGRLEDAEIFYQEFLEKFPNKFPNWIVRIRLVQLKSFSKPIEALQDMLTLANQLPEPEGQDLAKLYALPLSSDPSGPDPENILKEVGKKSLSDYTLIEHRLQLARFALSQGDINTAFKAAKEIWTKFPNHNILREIPLLFDRILLMHTENLLRENQFEDLVVDYIQNKKRFRNHRKKALIHLMVARAMRSVAMYEEAATEVIEKNGLKGTPDDEVKAKLNLELVSVLREKIEDIDPEPNDVNKFKIAFQGLEKNLPGKFNNYDYLLSKGYFYAMTGKLNSAKDVYLYALNSPDMTPLQRLYIAKQIINIYLKTPNYEKAISAIEVSLDIYKEYEKTINAPGIKADLLWQLVELNILSKKWDEVVSSTKSYLDESQAVMNRLDRASQEIEYSRRYEALFFIGYSLAQMSDTVGARRRWDLLSKEVPNDLYGKMAEDELHLLSWKELVYPKILKDLNR